ncbi:MAG: thioredoxin family protein [Rhizobiaceae bacterium]|nr:thioredoxin family protein [Rhizobiaceae bacterium]
MGRGIKIVLGRLVLGVALPLASMACQSASAAELLMFHQKACAFCDAFKREIAPDYPRSQAGALAPLRLVDIWESRTGGIEGLEPAVFTPTFVLVEGGREIGRMLGYPGQRYFYPEIQSLIGQLGGPEPAAEASGLDATASSAPAPR